MLCVHRVHIAPGTVLCSGADTGNARDVLATRRTAMQQRGGGSGLTHEMVTTAFDLDGFRVVRNLGVVRGITVRSRSVLGNIGAGVQALFGGNITLYTEL